MIMLMIKKRKLISNFIGEKMPTKLKIKFKKLLKKLIKKKNKINLMELQFKIV